MIKSSNVISSRPPPAFIRLAVFSLLLFVTITASQDRQHNTAVVLCPLSVQGNQLVKQCAASSERTGLGNNDKQSSINAKSKTIVSSPIQLHGVSGTGALFSCVQGRGIFDGATGEAYMQGLKSWNINAIRVPMNEDCWLGINGVPPSYSGTKYQTAMRGYVQSLVEFGFYVILELHWTASGSTLSTSQQPMPDKDHAVDFWTSVARSFGQDQRVIFDVFNEPYPDNNSPDSVAAWECWKYGRTKCTNLPYVAVGMDELVSALRNVNTTNVLMLGGINYANSLTQWIQYAPADPLHRMTASWHSYATNLCNNWLCWVTEIAPVMKKYPVITGEIGENDCQGKYIDSLMNWLDQQNVEEEEEETKKKEEKKEKEGREGVGSSYLAWVWEPWPCDTGPSLIVDYNGTCTDSYGCAYKKHILSRP